MDKVFEKVRYETWEPGPTSTAQDDELLLMADRSKAAKKLKQSVRQLSLDTSAETVRRRPKLTDMFEKSNSDVSPENGAKPVTIITGGDRAGAVEVLNSQGENFPVPARSRRRNDSHSDTPNNASTVTSRHFLRRKRGQTSDLDDERAGSRSSSNFLEGLSKSSRRPPRAKLEVSQPQWSRYLSRFHANVSPLMYAGLWYIPELARKRSRSSLVTYCV